MYCSNCGIELIEGSKFCSGCGVAISKDENLNEEEVLFSLRPKGIVIDDNKTLEVDAYVKKLMGAKHSDDVIYDVLFTNQKMYLCPVGKSGFLGTFITMMVAPGLATSVDYLSRKSATDKSKSTISVGEKFESKQLAIYPSMQLSTLTLVKETKKHTNAILVFKGKLNYGDKSIDGEIHVVTNGSISLSQQRIPKIENLINLLKIDLSKIMIF